MRLACRRVLSEGEIEARADGFRRQYAPLVRGILDLDVIVEHDLGIQIVPIEGIVQMTDKRGCLACSGNRIIVDAGVMAHTVEEYRFLLAEEVGHSEIHAYLLPNALPADRDDYSEWRRGITPVMEALIDWEARSWAGRVLVPRRELLEVFHVAVVAARHLFKTFDLSEAGQAFVESEVASHFGVTPHCAARRIEDERLWQSARAGRSTG